MRWFNYLQSYTLFGILGGWGLNIFRISGHCSKCFIVCLNLSRQTSLLQRFLVAWSPPPPQTHSYTLWHVSGKSWGGGGVKEMLFLGYATVFFGHDISNYYSTFTFMVKPSDFPKGENDMFMITASYLDPSLWPLWVRQISRLWQIKPDNAKSKND
jgi:hypothetical protein